MSRASAVALGLALFAVLALAALAWSGIAVLPSCLAGWLLVSAFPLGALPLVLASEALGLREGPLLHALRRLLWLMPLTSILAIPILFGRGGLVAPAPALSSTFARGWMADGLVVGRTVLFLVVWNALAWVFARPRPDGMSRGAPARLGLGLHLVMATVLATDWVTAVEPGLNSSCLGLLLIAAQSGVASSAATILAIRADRSRWSQGAGAVLATLSGLWLFAHFTQYLVVWSANLPDEVSWYLQRDGGWGGVCEAVAVLACGAAVAASVGRWRASVWLAVAALLLAVHALEMFWLVVPAGRGGFVVTWADLAAFVVAFGAVGALAFTELPGEGRARVSYGS